MLVFPSNIGRRLLIPISLLLWLSDACVAEDKFEKPGLCKNAWISNISILELQSFYEGETILIQEDRVIEGYIISSDREGNFYGSIHIQDLPEDPTSGFEILVDLPNTYLFYPPGHRITIRLAGLYLGKDGGNFQLGGVASFFEQRKVGRLPGNLVERHLQLSCEESTSVLPKSISLERLEDENPSTFVEIDSVQFPDDLIGLPFAEIEEETTRMIEDCHGNAIELLNSGYSDFGSSLLPGGSGKIRGILSKERDQFRLILNQLSDVNFGDQRCPSGPEPISSDSIFISEIADPDNNSEARFVELFNAGDQEVPLLGWKLERYTNDNLNKGSVIDLSEFSIKGNGTILIASNSIVFEEVFGIPPDLEGGKNSAADSNGDDNLVLRDAFDNVKDIFGRIGEDGSNTDHEFEDGKAIRKIDIRLGSIVYNPAEWIIYNDTGLAGTINRPQQAPEDFTPGKR